MKLSRLQFYLLAGIFGIDGGDEINFMKLYNSGVRNFVKDSYKWLWYMARRYFDKTGDIISWDILIEKISNSRILDDATKKTYALELAPIFKEKNYNKAINGKLVSYSLHELQNMEIQNKFIDMVQNQLAKINSASDPDYITEQIKESVMQMMNELVYKNEESGYEIIDYARTFEERQQLRKTIKEQKDKFPVFKYRYDNLQLILGKGHRFGELIVNSAVSGVGKSIWSVDVATTAMEQKLNVLYITAENTIDQVTTRFDANLTGLSYDQIQNDNLSPRYKFVFEAKYHKLMDRNKRLRILKVNPIAFDVSIIEHAMQELKESGFVPQVLIIDSPDHMRPAFLSDNNKLTQGRDFPSTKVYWEIKYLTLKYNLITFVTSQLKRSAKEKTIDEITDADIADDYNKVRIADYVIVLWNTPAEEFKMYFKVVKARDARLANKVVYLTAIYPTIRFSDPITELKKSPKFIDKSMLKLYRRLVLKDNKVVRTDLDGYILGYEGEDDEFIALVEYGHYYHNDYYRFKWEEQDSLKIKKLLKKAMPQYIENTNKLKEMAEKFPDRFVHTKFEVDEELMFYHRVNWGRLSEVKRFMREGKITYADILKASVVFMYNDAISEQIMRLIKLIAKGHLVELRPAPGAPMMESILNVMDNTFAEEDERDLTLMINGVQVTRPSGSIGYENWVSDQLVQLEKGTKVRISKLGVLSIEYPDGRYETKMPKHLKQLMEEMRHEYAEKMSDTEANKLFDDDYYANLRNKVDEYINPDDVTWMPDEDDVDFKDVDWNKMPGVDKVSTEDRAIIRQKFEEIINQNWDDDEEDEETSAMSDDNEIQDMGDANDMLRAVMFNLIEQGKSVPEEDKKRLLGPDYKDIIIAKTSGASEEEINIMIQRSLNNLKTNKLIDDELQDIVIYDDNNDDNVMADATKKKDKVDDTMNKRRGGASKNKSNIVIDKKNRKKTKLNNKKKLTIKITPKRNNVKFDHKKIEKMRQKIWQLHSKIEAMRQKPTVDKSGRPLYLVDRRKWAQVHLQPIVRLVKKRDKLIKQLRDMGVTDNVLVQPQENHKG